VRGRPGEKGGRDTASAIGPEAADHRLESGDLEDDPHGDRFERLALHEHGAEGLILTVEGLLGLDEELSVAAPLHHAGSLLLIIFRPGIAVERIPKTRAEPGPTRPLVRIGPQKAGGKPPEASRQSRFCECRYVADRTALGWENNQGSGHRNEEIPEEPRGLIPESLIIFQAAEVGDDGIRGPSDTGTRPARRGTASDLPGECPVLAPRYRRLMGKS